MRHLKHQCSECSHELKLLKGKYDYYGYCPDCFHFEGIIRDENKCCIKPTVHFVRHTVSNGSFQLRRQCQHCWTVIGSSLPHKTVDNIYALKVSDYKYRDHIDKLRRDEKNAKRKFVLRKFKAKTGVTTDITYGPFSYLEYLQSDKWKEKRKLVLRRDNFLCQSCLSNEAQQVHHLTYKHLANEPLFDLVSVCSYCHNQITQMDNDCEAKEILHLDLLKRVLDRKQAS